MYIYIYIYIYLYIYGNIHSSTRRQQDHLPCSIFILRLKTHTFILSQNVANVLTTYKNY